MVEIDSQIRGEVFEVEKPYMPNLRFEVSANPLLLQGSVELAYVVGVCHLRAPVNQLPAVSCFCCRFDPPDHPNIPRSLDCALL